MVDESYTCIDCGGTCHRISHEPHEGWAIGDVVAYRCSDCWERFDIVIEADDEGAGDSFDPRLG